MYKVKYNTNTILKNGDIGNGFQTFGEIAYMDCELSEVENNLCVGLEQEKRSPCISEVILVRGKIIPDA